MTPPSPSLIDRLSHVAQNARKMSVKSYSAQSSPEYQLDDLNLQPSEAWRQDGDDIASVPMRGSPILTSQTKRERKPSADRRDDSVGSYSKRKARPMFAGPPAPIASSMMVSSRQLSPISYDQEQERESYGLIRTMGRSIGHVMFDQKAGQDAAYNQRPDTTWRGLRRRERALEADIQQLLDAQVAGLVSGTQTGDASITSRENDVHSDAGSSTPTGTFYSTATSRSQMPRSLYIPQESTPEGNVVPVRQPARTRPVKLVAARDGLLKAILSLVELRHEENDQIDIAIRERKDALTQVRRLGSRQLGLQSELAAFDGDKEEPLGKQVRELEARYSHVNQEISLLEERLTSLRNQRRWLKNEMDDAKGKREAGLSGYRGALKAVNSALTLLLRRPPILPLDPAVFNQSGGALGDEIAVCGGSDFLRLIPERRTPEMAKSWWEAELEILDKRRIQIDEERQALEKGAAVWDGVIALVSGFESELRRLLRGRIISPTAASAKGKEKVPSENDLVLSQLEGMNRVLSGLEEAMSQAEAEGWNLLICAIGAELEAFREARDVLNDLSSTPNPGRDDENGSLFSTGQSSHTTDEHEHAHDGSDNDVPLDLLISHIEEAGHSGSKNLEDAKPKITMGDDRPQSQDSENEVPLEFLAEHL